MKFALDTNASRFSVQAFATGMLSTFGHNPKIAIRDYDGEIQFAPDTYENAAVRVTVATTGGIPSDGTAGAAVVNLTGVAGSASTYLSLFPQAQTLR